MRIQRERLRVVLAANFAMVQLYRDVGKLILDRQDDAGWGARIIDRLSPDLQSVYPDMKGFSPRNLLSMRSFAAAYPVRPLVKQLVSQSPIELMATPFNPGFVGQVSLNLSAVDDVLRRADDKPTIGLLLCQSRNKIVVEYALRNLKRPIGVAEWETKLVERLPDDLGGVCRVLRRLRRSWVGEEGMTVNEDKAASVIVVPQRKAEWTRGKINSWSGHS